MDEIKGEVTDLLLDLRSGSSQAEDRLISAVYKELKQLAAAYLRKERHDHTLQPTALVNEAYLRLIGLRNVDWQSRVHFFAIAARLMRRILIDHARAHRAGKRGGSRPVIQLNELLVSADSRSEQFIALDEALIRLSRLDPRQGKIVELKFFGGLTEEEIANLLGVSTRTIKRDWRVARAWLFRELSTAV